MRSVKLLTDAMRAAAGIEDRWYVSTGEGAVGPVRLELLARGIEAGMVPLDSYVRNEAWTVWRPLSDIMLVSGTLHEAAGPSQWSPIAGPAEAFEDLVIRDSHPTLPSMRASSRGPGSRPSSDWDNTPTPRLPTPGDPTLHDFRPMAPSSQASLER
jgi:hypothetical protein